MSKDRFNFLRSMAESERLMDEGKILWVWAPNMMGTYDRLAVAPNIMEKLGLEQGQTINTQILDAVASLSNQILIEKLDDIIQAELDKQLDPNFDFRSMM